MQCVILVQATLETIIESEYLKLNISLFRTMRISRVNSDQTHITVKDRLFANFKGPRHTVHNNQRMAWVGKTLNI